MRKILHFAIFGVIALSTFSCVKEDIYKRPGWLAGKLYTQIEDREDLTTFAQAIHMVGYDSIINVSGSYTVFAPDNTAWDQYFDEHPGYTSLEDIPAEELLRIVKYHIVQNPWSYEQLRKLDVNGWIDTTQLTNNEPRGFKRETLLREKNTKYGVDKSMDVIQIGEEKKYIIVDTLASDWYRRNATDARKFAPLFYSQYFDLYDLNSNDYAFYFNRPFESSKTYFVGAEIKEWDIFAENGFVHIIDRVVDPLENAYQIMSKQYDGYSYTKFMNLVNTFPDFTYSYEKTMDQPGASQGYEVDSLFDISYPELTFGIINEKTVAPSGSTGLPGNVTIRYQHGLIAPTNAALDEFVSQYLSGGSRWGSLEQAPIHIRRMVINTHMSSSSIFPSNMTQGYYNGEDDLITVDPSTIIQKQYGSNCTFIGVNKVMVPRAFTAVTGPVYLQKGYSRVMYAIERAGLLPALKRTNNNYMFFVEKDANLSLDSSLFYNTITKRFAIYQVYEGGANAKTVTTTDLRNLLLNHIGTRQATGVPRKEFIRNLAGNYIVVNNLTGEVSGSSRTTFGYQGTDYVTVVPTLISNADNGKTYDISNWFNFSAANLYLTIQANYPVFHNLLISAGLADTRNYRYTFMSSDENYTVFIPTDAALAAYNIGSLTTEELKKFLMMHFIQGSLLFTDGYAQPGYYETARVDEKSTEFTKIFTRLYINPVTDAIQFKYKNGTNYVTVNESNTSNIMTARTINPDLTHPTIVTNGVIHQVDKVFVFSDMDTE